MSASTKVWVNNSAPTCEDDDLNGFKNENNNLILGSGQSLNTGDLQQTHKAVAQYSTDGDFFSDSGASNAYVLSATGAKEGPTAYADGMRVRFRAANDSSAASTVNVASLGLKDITFGGAAISSDQISGEVELIFNSSNDEFELNTKMLPTLTIEHQEASGVSAGSPSGGTFAKRTLNTVLKNDFGASLSSSVITIPAGKYKINGFSTGRNCAQHKCRLRDTTNNSTLIQGSSEDSDTAPAIGNNSIFSGVISAATSIDIEIQHWFNGPGSNAFGFSVTTGEPELYAAITFERLS